MPRRSTAKKQHEARYTSMHLSLSVDPPPKQLTGSMLLEILDFALTGLYGIIGGAIVVDLINFDKSNATGVIRCRESDQQPIWAAAAFLTEYKGSICRIEVMDNPQVKVVLSMGDREKNIIGGVGKLGDRATSDVLVRLTTGDGRDDWFYTHSAIICAKSKYFATRLLDDKPTHRLLDSRNCIEVLCSENDFDYHVMLLRLLYASQDDLLTDIWHNVRNAIGVVKVASRLGCDEIVRKCVQYLESVPWEESEEEEILETLPSLGSTVQPVLARLQPVDPDVMRDVFLSALRVATSEKTPLPGCFLINLKASAQEQVEYMLVEDDDAPLIIADNHIRSEFRKYFWELFQGFRVCIMTMLLTVHEDEISEQSLLEKLSDLVWASRVLPRVNLLHEIVWAWSESSKDIVCFLEDAKLKTIFWNTKLKVMEITSKVLEAVGYGNVLLPADQRTGLIKVWLPYIRGVKPLLESEFTDETVSVNMDNELCQNIESAMTSLILSLPSGDQAEILADWLKHEHAKYPDLSEAFEVWCFRSKAAKRRLNGVEMDGLTSVPILNDSNGAANLVI